MVYMSTSQIDNWYKRAFGQKVRAQLSPYVRDCIDAKILNVVVGAGKAYLKPKDPVLMFNLGPQGTSLWGTPNKTALMYEDAWPLPDCSVDRLILIHSLEFTQDPKAFLAEAHRVLTHHGLMMVFWPRVWASYGEDARIVGKNFSLFTMRQMLVGADFQLIAHQSQPLRFMTFPKFVLGSYHGLCGRKHYSRPAWLRSPSWRAVSQNS
jgi:hypothetical protein